MLEDLWWISLDILTWLGRRCPRERESRDPTINLSLVLITALSSLTALVSHPISFFKMAEHVPKAIFDNMSFWSWIFFMHFGMGQWVTMTILVLWESKHSGERTLAAPSAYRHRGRMSSRCLLPAEELMQPPMSMNTAKATTNFAILEDTPEAGAARPNFDVCCNYDISLFKLSQVTAVQHVMSWAMQEDWTQCQQLNVCNLLASEGVAFQIFYFASFCIYNSNSCFRSQEIKNTMRHAFNHASDWLMQWGFHLNQPFVAQKSGHSPTNCKH